MIEISTQLLQTQIPHVLIFFPFFLTIYLIGYFIIFKNWSPEYRPEAASCCISLCHGTPVAILAAFSIISQTHLPTFNSPNTHLQKLVLEFSIAYFIMDLIHYLIFYPKDLLFIGHHLAVLFVFFTGRYFVSHGAFAILVLLILSEVTSLFQNLWTLANAKRDELEFAAKAYMFLTPPFYVLYTIARGILGPLFVYKMGRFYSSGGVDGLIPTWVWCSWIGVVATAILVSNLWIWNLWVELFSTQQSGLQKKVQ